MAVLASRLSDYAVFKLAELSNNAVMNNSRSENPQSSDSFSYAGLSLLYMAAFVVTVAGIRAAAAIVVPLLLALFFSVVCTPPLQALQRRLPFPAALMLIMCMLITIFLCVPILIGGSFRQVLRTLPELQLQLQQLGMTMAAQLEAWDVGVTTEDLAVAFDPAWATSMLSGFFNGLLRAFGDGIVVLIMTGFMLTEATWFTEKLAIIEHGSGESNARIEQAVVNARRYLSIKTVVSIATGISIWLGLKVLDVEFAAVWGFVAFLLNYVPTVGSIIAGVPPVLLALVYNGMWMALAVAVWFLAVNQIYGSIVEPRLQGRGLGLSPLIVFVSLVFWGWVLGPVGMLLSAPLTMVLRIACEEFPETEWIAVLLAGRPANLSEEARSRQKDTSGCEDKVPS